MYIFRNQFHLTEKEATGLRDICIFVVTVYSKAWFTAPIPPAAPRNDLDFLQRVIGYEKGKADIKEEILRKFKKHLWYLSESLIALALFDKGVSNDCKRLMSDAIINREGCTTNARKFKLLDDSGIADLSLDQFVTKNSLSFFGHFGLSTDFLRYDPETWDTREDFKSNLLVVQSLQAVNDRAEQAMALITDYNGRRTNDENSKQALLISVAAHRAFVPNCSKGTLKKSFKAYIFEQ